MNADPLSFRRSARPGRFLAGLLLLAVALLAPVGVDRTEARPSELPLPRFVSLKRAPANVRRGPGTRYAIEWRYTRKGMPIEIFQEYGNWRRVRDKDGSTGWLHGSLLSGRRSAVVAPWAGDWARLRDAPSATATVLARIEPGVRLLDPACDGTWCEVEVKRTALAGYVAQDKLWGNYPGEIVGEIQSGWRASWPF